MKRIFSHSIYIYIYIALVFNLNYGVIQSSFDSLDHADQTQINQIYVYLPKEIRECVEYLKSLREPAAHAEPVEAVEGRETSPQNISNQENISYDDAQSLIFACKKLIADNAAIDEKNKKIIEAYLDEYEHLSKNQNHGYLHLRYRMKLNQLEHCANSKLY